MAISFDTAAAHLASSSSTSTVAVAASTSNSLAIIWTWNGNGADLTSVTVDGNAATKITSVNSFGAQWQGAYYYVNPPTSSVNYVATATSSADDVEIMVAIYAGASLSGIPDSYNTGSATGNLTLSTTVVSANCWLASQARNFSSGIPGAGTGTTSRDTPVTSGFGDSNGTVGTGSQSMQWTAASGTTAGIILSFAPAAANNSNFFMFMR